MIPPSLLPSISRLAAIVSIFLSAPLQAAVTPGSLDTLDVHVSGGEVSASAGQPDGKTIIIGGFSSVQGIPRNHIARLNDDGSLDTEFDPKPNGPVACVALQADGKILLGGNFLTLQPNGDTGTTARKRVARLNPDGTLDMEFDPNADGAGGSVECLAIQTDGKILIGGQFGTFQPNGAPTATTRLRIARLNEDGTLDPAFNPKANGPVECIAIQENGKILLGGSFTTLQPNGAASTTNRQYVARVNADGTLDTGFDPKANGHVSCLVAQPDGKILIGGEFYTLQPNGAASATVRIHLARVNGDGSLDATFNPVVRNSLAGLIGSGNDGGGVGSMVVQTDGKILIGGQFLTLQPNGTGAWIDQPYIARLNSNGSLDAGFSPGDATYGTFGMVRGVMLQPDGKVLLGGDFRDSPVTRDYFERLHNDTATRSLTVLSTDQVLWQRGGSSPELSQVTFEKSMDAGASWSLLGNGTRVGTTANWQLTGLTLPASGLIRVRGRTSGGACNASSGLIELAVNYTIGSPSTAVPVFIGPATATGTVGQNFSYTALFTNNPSYYAARGLPLGLSINTATGAISGAPFAAGTYTAYLDASNNAGVSAATTPLVFTIREAPTEGERYTFTLFAGKPDNSGSADGTGSAARFSTPTGLAVDSADNVYVADTDNHTIRKITSTGVVSTLAGSAYLEGDEDGTGSIARFANPRGVAVGSSGVIYVADWGNGTIRKVTSAGAVTTLKDNTGETASFFLPKALVAGSGGSLYITEFSDSIQRISSSGVISTFAGSSDDPGSNDGSANTARFSSPYGLAFDDAGNLHVADLDNHTVRKINSNGIVTTYAGTAGTSGDDDGGPGAALLADPVSLAADNNGNIYVSEFLSGHIRKIHSGGVVKTLVNADGTPTHFQAPQGLASDGLGRIYISDTLHDAIYMGVPAELVEKPVFNRNPSPKGTVGQPYSYTPSFSGNPLSYNASNLPPGLAINTTTGEISGTPTDPGVPPDQEDFAISYGVSIFATNGGGTTATLVFLTINPEPIPPVFTSPTTANGVVGQSFSYTAAFVGTLRSYTVGTLPGGLSYNSSTRVISGTPSAAGTYTITFSAQNRNLTATGHGVLTLTVKAASKLSSISVKEGSSPLVDGVSTTSFGLVKLKSPLVKTFTIKNLGSVKLEKLAISKNGMNAGDFTATAPLLTNLAAGASTTFKVTFKPTAAGSRTAAIHIKCSNANVNEFDIKLAGKGTSAVAAGTGSPRLESMADRVGVTSTGQPNRESFTTVERVNGLGYLTLTVVRQPGSPSTEPIVEVSPNLIDWYSGHQHTTILQDDALLLKIRDNTPVHQGVKRYIHVKEIK